MSIVDRFGLFGAILEQSNHDREHGDGKDAARNDGSIVDVESRVFAGAPTRKDLAIDRVNTKEEERCEEKRPNNELATNARRHGIDSDLLTIGSLASFGDLERSSPG